MMRYQDIFYPSDRDELLALAEGEENGVPGSSAYILPHMDLRRCASLYRSVFRSIEDGKRIRVLVPVHREPLIKDGDERIFSLRDERIETPLGSVRIIGEGLADGSHYAEEEYSWELMMPFIAYYLPSSPVSVIFSAASSSKDVKALREFLHKDSDDEIYIISSNMTGRLPQESVIKETDRMIGLLEKGDHLLDLWRHGAITACGVPLIESIRGIVDGDWHLIGKCADDRAAGHAALYKAL